MQTLRFLARVPTFLRPKSVFAIVEDKQTVRDMFDVETLNFDEPNGKYELILAEKPVDVIPLIKHLNGTMLIRAEERPNDIERDLMAHKLNVSFIESHYLDTVYPDNASFIIGKSKND